MINDVLSSSAMFALWTFISDVNLAVLPVAVIVVVVCDQVHLSSTGHTHSRDGAPVSSSPVVAARRSRRKIGR